MRISSASGLTAVDMNVAIGKQPRDRGAGQLRQPAAAEVLAGQQPGRRSVVTRSSSTPTRRIAYRRPNAVPPWSMQIAGRRRTGRTAVGCWLAGARTVAVATASGDRPMLGGEIGGVVRPAPVRRRGRRAERPAAGPDGAVGGDCRWRSAVRRRCRRAGAKFSARLWTYANCASSSGDCHGGTTSAQPTPMTEDDAEQRGEAPGGRQDAETAAAPARYLGRARHGCAG